MAPANARNSSALFIMLSPKEIEQGRPVTADNSRKEACVNVCMSVCLCKNMNSPLDHFLINPTKQNNFSVMFPPGNMGVSSTTGTFMSKIFIFVKTKKYYLFTK